MSNNYFSNAVELIEKAKNHFEDMDNRFYEEIGYSERHSRIFEDDLACSSMKKCDTSLFDYPEIKIAPYKTQDALFYSDVRENLYPIVLNFASFKNPGGMFLQGSSAQEESLCHSSTLFNVQSRFVESYYDINKMDINNHLYTNRCLYNPYIIFENDRKENVAADVLTIAAPNWKSACKYSKVSVYQNSEALLSRIKFTLRCAYTATTLNECKEKSASGKVLYLGAFGCGVFAQDPFEVATAFKSFIDLGEANCFKKIVFAIPTGKNLDAFMTVFCR